MENSRIIDKEIALNILNDNKDWLHEIKISDELSDDNEVIIAAVNKNAWLVRFASKRLLQDEELFRYCISQNPRVFECFDKKMFTNTQLVIELLDSLIEIHVDHHIYLELIKLIPNNFIEKNEVASKLALCWFCHYNCLNDEQKSNKELTICVVTRNRKAIASIPKHFLEDRDIISASVSSYPMNIRYFSPEIRTDKVIGLMAVEKNAGSLRYLSPELKDDYDIVKTAIKRKGLAIQYASQRLRSNEELALIAMHRNNRAKSILDKLDVSLLSNKKVIMSAFNEDFEKAARLADAALLKDPDVLNTIFRRLDKDKYGYYISAVKETVESLQAENPDKYEFFSQKILEKISVYSL